jgi:DNA replicative helicase MCM subunit Mcm2 (Cdc46/Mcm family)
MTTDTKIFRTTTRLKQHGYVTIIIPREIRTALDLTEGDMLDITITRTEDDDQDTNKYIKSISTRIEKIKYIKKTIRELQTFHTDGKSYVAFKELVESTGKVGIDKDELEAILDLLKNCGDVIELPEGCWRTV